MKEVYCHYKNEWIPLGRARSSCPICGAGLDMSSHKIRDAEQKAADYHATIKRAQQAVKTFTVPLQIFRRLNGKFDYLPVGLEIRKIFCVVSTEFSDYPRKTKVWKSVIRLLSVFDEIYRAEINPCYWTGGKALNGICNEPFYVESPENWNNDEKELFEVMTTIESRLKAEVLKIIESWTEENLI